MKKLTSIFAVLTLLLTTSVYAQDVLRTDSTSNVTSETTTTVISPPPTAVSPSFGTSGNDLCTVGISGAVQTQILGISAGKTVRDMNCEKLKNAKTLYDMGMKVAAVSVMCQDKRVFDAMMDAGTPCPFDGNIGEDAKLGWEQNPHRVPGHSSSSKFGISDENRSTTYGLGAMGALLLLLLL